MAKIGRPTKFNEPLAAKICERVALGESMRSIGRDPAMPHVMTMLRWTTMHDSFRVQYDRACIERGEVLAEQALEIADSADPENVSVAKLQVDTRKWFASKLKPKRFGDKAQMELSGKDGEPIEVDTTWRIEVAK